MKRRFTELKYVERTIDSSDGTHSPHAELYVAASGAELTSAPQSL